MAAVDSRHASRRDAWECISPQPEDQDGVEGEQGSPSVRYGHTALLHNRQMVVTHGYFFSEKRGSCFLDDTWSFDVDATELSQHPWTCISSSGPVGSEGRARAPGASTGADGATLPPLPPPPRFHHSAVEHDGGMFIFGGTDGGLRNNRDGGSKSFRFGPDAEMSDLWRFSLDGKGGTTLHQWQQLSAPLRFRDGNENSEISPSSSTSSSSSSSSSSMSPESAGEVSIGSEGSSEASVTPVKAGRPVRALWGHPGGDDVYWPEPRAEHGAAFSSGRLWVYGGLRGDSSGTADGLDALGDLWSCVLAKKIVEKRQPPPPPPPPAAATEAAAATPNGSAPPTPPPASPSSYEVRWECRWDYHGGLGGGKAALPVGARYGHACVPGRMRSGDGSDFNGFFVVGGRRRELVSSSGGSSGSSGSGGKANGVAAEKVRGDRSIVNDVWWCDTTALLACDTGGADSDREGGAQGPPWRRLSFSHSPKWQPRFNFAAAALPAREHLAGGLVVFGGNVSTGLLRLPVDGWMLRWDGGDDGGIYDSSGSSDTAESRAAKALEEGGVVGGGASLPLVELAAEGLPDTDGHVHPYGRVHATIVVVPPLGSAGAGEEKSGDGGGGSGGSSSSSSSSRRRRAGSLLLFGGESTRPYMYHAGVWRAPL